MGGFFRWSGLVVFGTVVIAVSLYTVSRLMPMPAEDAEALALIEAPRPMEGRNGFAALWSLRHDVPVAEAERLLVLEVERFRSRPILIGAGAEPSHASALDAYPRIDAEAGSDVLCSGRETQCLRHVRDRMDALVPAVAMRKALAARVAVLDDYEYFRSPFPARPDTPLPAYNPLFQTQTLHAYAFARGDREEGLRGVCRNASIARKLVASGDMLVGGVMGTALMDTSTRLFVDMLAELPADHPLPEECAAAFDADDAMLAGICPSMLGEGHYVLEGFRAMNVDEQPWHRRFMADIFLDQRKTMARGARRHAWFCGAQADALIRADTPLSRQAPVSGGWTFSCLANATGCILDNIAAPSLAGYAERFQDAEARLRTVSAWRALRGQRDDARPLEERLDEWQRAHPGGRRMRIGTHGGGLEIDLFNDSQGRGFALPPPVDRADLRAP
ncbi:MAG: hypothetical protein DI562_20830 [Stenotrophomonas acidaminiphila]|nr:MAG: hypothetical protein DI562_20830 [Stenotrophomonas acidaminiphila]